MTHMDAKAAFEAFKNAKADSSMTNGQVASKYTLLADKERQLRKAGEAQKKVQELEVENARLKALVEGKGKATGKAA